MERYFVDQKDYFQNKVIIELIVLGHLEIPSLSPIYQEYFEIYSKPGIRVWHFEYIQVHMKIQ